jgi:hypothetical protein
VTKVEGAVEIQVAILILFCNRLAMKWTFPDSVNPGEGKLDRYRVRTNKTVSSNELNYTNRHGNPKYGIEEMGLTTCRASRKGVRRAAKG